jgi:hypothetical protein
MPITRRTAAGSVSLIAKVVALAVFAATPLAAQTVPTVASRASMVSQLDEGAGIRVAIGGGGVIEGRFVRLDHQSLVLRFSDPRDVMAIPLAEIDTLWTSVRSHGQGFFPGALIGGLLGGVGVGSLAGGVSSGTNERCNCASTIVGAVGASAFLGGVVGAAIGSSTWEKRWPQ